MSKEELDKYELYSFSTYLYLYGFFYLFIFEQTFIRGLLINLFVNILMHYFFNQNIISFISHKYWKRNLNDISMPQLLTCLTNITLYTSFSNSRYAVVILPSNILMEYFIRKIYKKEIIYSKNLRLIIYITFFLFYQLPSY